jgi:uncharacterized protein YdhG (YjbR/CyaY superfamily)
MQHDVGSPAEYLDGHENDWRRETLLSLRSIIQKWAPHLIEGIDYKMLSYRDKEAIVFCLNVQKSYVSLYVGDIRKIDLDGSMLDGLSHGKGCIRFKKSNKVDSTQIEAFIK